MSHAAENHADLGWNPEDPHGIHGDHAHHGHVVVSWQLQLVVLASLLFFTALTVAFFLGERWVEVAFGIHLPKWVNIVGAMSIASVKATLVCMYFMQLRYDKPLNTFCLLYCLFAVGLFLFFSSLDLSTRGWVNDFKFGEAQSGGTGVALGVGARDPNFDARVSPRVETQGKSLIDARRAEYQAKWMKEDPSRTDKDWWAYYYGHVKHPKRMNDDTENYFVQLGFAHDTDSQSSADRSIPNYERSNALDLAEPGHDAHAGGHGDDHASDH